MSSQKGTQAIFRGHWKGKALSVSDTLQPRGLLLSSVHGILQARILECVAAPFSKGFSERRSPAMQVESLRHQGSCKYFCKGSLCHCNFLFCYFIMFELWVPLNTNIEKIRMVDFSPPPMRLDFSQNPK